jgi:hypothetical protein
VDRDERAVGVDRGEERLVVGAEALRERPLRVGDRRPRPAELLDELARAVGRVGGVQAEEGELRVLLGESCVGTRLAPTGESPGGPDVHEHGPACEVGERDRAAVERPPRELRRGSTRADLAAGRGDRRIVLDRGGRLAPAAAGEEERSAER